ncbi:carboxypeptidase-like regulatory domain-containing protein [Jiulongibacter sediminis]|uniref:Secretin/TonB short N-terminal domain-containing protein n=1 Tax=Jiulongibacter sediminis TaxID=1605367 RepID=A0A0N8H9B5_9BACT|nr:carboxypeptidase-like regulatory domain-containing protein [Jiulongibacter sediminis]KPM46908.1 hypothetical protein AFM12_16870 [Jiulongibacter sediminis]TBX22256.1 hypothetical protein TK44_16880 [Jiulongibacter sediminis]
MKKLIIIPLLFFIVFSARAQSSTLEKRVSINISNQPLELALKMLEKESEVHFSYNPRVLEFDKNINYKAESRTLDHILNEILGPSISYKVHGTHIILQKAPKRDFYISGYVRDGESGQEIKNVSIYEPQTLASALTNTHGYYKIKLPVQQKDIDLKFSKEDYDLLIQPINNRSDQKLSVELQKTIKPKVLTAEVSAIKTPQVKLDTTPKIEERLSSNSKPQPVPVPEMEEKEKKVNLDFSEELAFIDTTYQKGKDHFLNWLMTTKQNLHFRNIQDSLYKPFQISFLPFLGTNLRLGPVVTNDVSINLVAGYTGSVRKLEVGGVANFIRKDMTGVQAAGTLNLTGRSFAGVQAAGAANINLGTSSGIMAAGATNISVKDSKGLQAAGSLNVAFSEMRGTQIAPFNYATRLNGLQIGVFNMAYDRINNSVPIGFFSYVHKNGYRRLEFNASELNNTEISFKTGVQKFYNIFNTSFSYGRPNKPLAGVGYGLGTSWKYGERLGSNLDILSSVYFQDGEFSYLDQHYRASLGFEYKVFDRLAVFVAPTLNFYVGYDESLDFSSYKLLLSERTSRWFGENARTYTWLGYKFGLRLCNKS